MCMYDPYESESWVIFRLDQPRARKSHRCEECRRTISPGERYQRVSGITYDSDGWVDHKMCEHCTAAAQWLVSVCSGYVFGAVRQDLYEHVDGEERHLRSAPLSRLYRWMREGWQDHSGTLRPLADVEDVTRRAITAYRRQFTEATP